MMIFLLLFYAWWNCKSAFHQVCIQFSISTFASGVWKIYSFIWKIGTRLEMYEKSKNPAKADIKLRNAAQSPLCSNSSHSITESRKHVWEFLYLFSELLRAIYFLTDFKMDNIKRSRNLAVMQQHEVIDVSNTFVNYTCYNL